MGLLDNGAFGQLGIGIIGLWDHGTLGQWGFFDHGTLGPWGFGAMGLWAMVHLDHEAFVPWGSVTTGLCVHGLLGS